MKPSANVVKQLRDKLLLDHAVGEGVKGDSEYEHQARDQTARDVGDVPLHAAADVARKLVPLLQRDDTADALVRGGQHETQRPVEAHRGGQKEVRIDQDRGRDGRHRPGVAAAKYGKLVVRFKCVNFLGPASRIAVGPVVLPMLQSTVQFGDLFPNAGLQRQEIGRGHASFAQVAGELVDVPEEAWDINRHVEEVMQDVLGGRVALPRDGQPVRRGHETRLTMD